MHRAKFLTGESHSVPLIILPHKATQQEASGVHQKGQEEIRSNCRALTFSGICGKQP